ncbi:MAG: sodium:proton antiporter [Synergistaceae bacterium]|nr:sodium:proton antiporter [Synergistaceae bacterium]MBQ6738118.1 sodium:proton antiporter [Synergistaceae bacterium]MBQ7069381.1 sodium:proton antiporter [Synergistaceae bacterium]MBR0074557.1 sodium:proton antiporter [Synergistaceae bacterium]MBR0233697.1 sodium:proton antiporter [Synergistaceae bacterium]
MPEANEIQNYLLIGSAIFLSVSIFFCLLRATLGPRFSDRIIAANIIGTKIIVLIAVLSFIVGESYLADICLIYAIISFLSIVVLARSVIEKKEEDEKTWYEL